MLTKIFKMTSPQGNYRVQDTGQKQPTFWLQLKAMIIRNALLKVRKSKRTIAEIIIPLNILAVLVVMRVVIPNPHFPRVEEPRENVNLFEHFNNITTTNNITIAVAPNNTQVKKFMNEVLSTWFNQTNGTQPNNTESFKFVTFNSEKTLVRRYWKNPDLLQFGLVFESKDPYEGTLKYSILTSQSWARYPNTSDLYSSKTTCREVQFYSEAMRNLNASIIKDYKLPDSCPADLYYKSGFAALQVLVDFTKLRITLPDMRVAVPTILLNLLPKETYTGDWMFGFRVIVPLYIVMAVSQFITFLLILIVGEKEKKIKASMKVVGLRDSVYWISWLIIYTVFVFVTTSVCTFMLYYLEVFRHTSYIFIFLPTFLFSISIIVGSFMLTPFFDKGKSAGVFGSFLVNLSSLLYFIRVYFGDYHTNFMWIISLLSPTAFTLAMDKMLMLDLSGEGVSWSTIWSGPGFSFGDSLTMMVIDIFLYGLFTFYLDAVWPSEFGSKRHPLFFIPFYRKNQDSILITEENDSLNTNTKPLGDVEPVSKEHEQNVAVKIVGLHKTFSTFRRPLVKVLNGIDLEIYENEITAILGQNGAGKSTLFNILTGLTAPTSGTALVFNKDIRNSEHLTEIQRMTGVCLQTDILCEDLTAREHLTFFAKIRGMNSQSISSTVDRVLQSIDLQDIADSETVTLSGGQKRKLSIGIALIGDPKIILLDEPTAGVDAVSKRHIWSLLEKIKPSKVVMFTTHLMEEADIVADRKAIICKGKLRCCGTSLFLKNRFGIGSCLTLGFDEMVWISVIMRFIKRLMPSARFVQKFGKELHFTLPNDSMTVLAQLFSFIEKEIESPVKTLGITSYSVSMSSLEELYLRLTWDDDIPEEQEKNASKKNRSTSSTYLGATLHNSKFLEKNITSDETLMDMDVEYKPNVPQMLYAVLRLRLLRMYRDSYHLFVMFVFPMLLTVFGFYISKINNKKETSGTSHLSPEMYSDVNQVAVYNEAGVEGSMLISTLSPQANITSYNGCYASLLDQQPSLGAVNFNHYSNQKFSFTILYNDTMQHSLPILINLIDNAIFRMLVPDESGYNSSDSLSLDTHQLPLTFKPQELNIVALVSSLLLGMTFVLHPVSLVADLVYDRECKIKHLLHVNGLWRSVYFSAYVIMLGGTLAFVSVLLLALLFFLGLIPIAHPAAFLTMGLIILCYCPAVILFITCYSYFFEHVQTAQTVIPMTITWIGIIPFSMVVLLDMVGLGRTLHTMVSLTNIVYVPFAMFYFVNEVHIQCDIQMSCSQPSLSDYFTPEIVEMMIHSLLQFPFWGILLIFIDFKTSGKTISHAVKHLLKKNEIKIKQDHIKENTTEQTANLDSDVQVEKGRVLSILNEGHENRYATVVQNLSKVYERNQLCCSKFAAVEPKVAVRDLSIVVEEGEVFGLLGHNGAGKTTMMKIITGEEQATTGHVWIQGKRDTAEDSGLLGYCPQNNSLWTHVTVQEHLEIYAAIRGVPSKDLNRLVVTYLKGLRLLKHANNRVEVCSGGTQRKLNFAISMIGNSSAVLLDEPSSGMDTKSRRFLWNSIQKNFQGKRGAILSTHLIEEAEALCSRVGIMVNGDLRCLGTPKYLKTHFGGGYILEMKLSPSANKKEVQHFILSRFNDSTLKDHVLDRMVFSLPQQSVPSVANVFLLLESAKSDMGILMYSLNQTNLEQVFLKLSATV